MSSDGPCHSLGRPENFTGVERTATKDSQFCIITGIQSFVELL